MPIEVKYKEETRPWESIKVVSPMHHGYDITFYRVLDKPGYVTVDDDYWRSDTNRRTTGRMHVKLSDLEDAIHVMKGGMEP